MCLRVQMSLMALSLKKILDSTFLKNTEPKESFFTASDAVPFLYNKPCIGTGDWYLRKRLLKFETLEIA